VRSMMSDGPVENVADAEDGNIVHGAWEGSIQTAEAVSDEAVTCVYEVRL
jgi:hypothetical protein